jgi:hypothetical protein
MTESTPRASLGARRRWAAWVALLLLFAQFAGAQTLHVGVGAVVNSSTAPDLRARLAGVKPTGAPATSVTLEVRVPAPSLGLGLSTNQSFGPLGNLIIEAWAAVAPHPGGGAAAEGSVAARGDVGPVPVRLALLAYGAKVGNFRPADLASHERPDFQGPAGGLQLALTYRANRDLIFEVVPELYVTGAGLALRLDAGARLLRLFGENELRLGVHGYAVPGFGSAAVAAGAAVTFPRGREPDITVGLWVGHSSNGLWPGAHLSLGERLGQVRLDLTAAFEPYRLDVPALRVTSGVALPMAGSLPAGSQLSLNAAVASDLGVFSAAPTRAWAELGLTIPVSLR